MKSDERHRRLDLTQQRRRSPHRRPPATNAASAMKGSFGTYTNVSSSQVLAGAVQGQPSVSCHTAKHTGAHLYGQAADRRTCTAPTQNAPTRSPAYVYTFPYTVHDRRPVARQRSRHHYRQRNDFRDRSDAPPPATTNRSPPGACSSAPTPFAAPTSFPAPSPGRSSRTVPGTSPTPVPTPSPIPVGQSGAQPDGTMEAAQPPQLLRTESTRRLPADSMSASRTVPLPTRLV